MIPTAIVTGADSGIGRATAVALARNGLDVGITWRTDEDGARLTAERVAAAGRRAIVHELDLGAGLEAGSAVTAMADDLGGLGVLVNNAGVNHRCDALTEDLEPWRHVLEVNLTGSFVCAQAAARVMVRAGQGGRIVNVTSVHEHVPLRGGAAYSAAKAGLGLVTKVMALELAPHGITVNSVAPGHVATPMNGYAEGDPEATALPGVPMARVGRPEEVAAMIAHLASPEAGFTSGASIVVDGGLELMAVAQLQQAVEA